MADNPREARLEKAAREGQKAWAAHEAEADAVRKKTARLRALRLAKEAVDKEAADALPPVVKAAPKKSGAAKTTGAKVTGGTKLTGAKAKTTKAAGAKKAKAEKKPLAEWLTGERADGRRS